MIKLLHLYYDVMNLYGDYGNVSILKKHLEDQGFEVLLDKKTIGEEIDFDEYDFIFIGSGTERNLDIVLEDLRMYKENLKEYIDKEKVILLTGNSFEMLGKSIDEKEALKILDFEVKREKDRTTSDIIYKSKFLENKVVGFVNKCTKIYHNNNPFFEVDFGIGENENNDYEGIKYKNLYGTHVSGPILVRNPEFLKHIVETICKNRNKNFKCKELEYLNEKEGYELVLKELEKRKV